MHMISFFSRAPYLVTESLDNGMVPGQASAAVPGTASEEFLHRQTSAYYQFYQQVTLGVGILLSSCFTFQLALSISRQTKCLLAESMHKVRRLVSTSTEHGESRLKRAATRKLNTMLYNAHSMHRRHMHERHILIEQAQTSRWTKQAAVSASRMMGDDAVSNYLLHGERMVKCGGFIWTWLRILDGRLFHTEGACWLSVVAMRSSLFSSTVWLYRRLVALATGLGSHRTMFFWWHL